MRHCATAASERKGTTDEVESSNARAPRGNVNHNQGKILPPLLLDCTCFGLLIVHHHHPSSAACVRRFLLADTPLLPPRRRSPFTFAQFSSHLRRATENHPRPTTPKLESAEQHRANFATAPLCVFSRSFSSHCRQGAAALFRFPLRAGATTLPRTVPHSRQVRRRDDEQRWLDVPFDRGRASVTACRTHWVVQAGGKKWYREHAFTYTTTRALLSTHTGIRARFLNRPLR